MIECVKIEDVLTCIIFQVAGKEDLTCGELKEIIENLPTIKIEDEDMVEDEDIFENLIDIIYPVGSYYFNNYGLAINPNEVFDNTEREIEWKDCGGCWMRVK